MSKLRVVTLIFVFLTLAGIVTYINKNLQYKQVINSVEKYGGWIPMKTPYENLSIDYLDDPDNWKETEQLIGQTSLKFTSKNKFVCEWKPVQRLNKLLLLVTNCAELIGDQNEFRSLYILYKIGTSGNVESFFIPVGNDYSELVLPFITDPEDHEMSEVRIEHLKMRLSSENDIPPLVFERNGLLK
jgi:hypothetical protein